MSLALKQFLLYIGFMGSAFTLVFSAIVIFKICTFLFTKKGE